jgi:hypothetical protein
MSTAVDDTLHSSGDFSLETTLAKQITALSKLKTKQLQDRFGELFGETTQAHNRTWLIKRIAWRLQSLQEGDLSERARNQALKIANHADIRSSIPQQELPEPDSTSPIETATVVQPLVVHQSTGPKIDHRPPPPGTILTRHYKGREIQVMVLPIGFDFEGKIYHSLSAVAKQITGSHCNGFAFFKLNGGPA